MQTQIKIHLLPKFSFLMAHTNRTNSVMPLSALSVSTTNRIAGIQTITNGVIKKYINEMNVNTNKDILKELANGWKYITIQAQKLGDSNINNEKNVSTTTTTTTKSSTTTERIHKFKKHIRVCLVGAPDCVGKIDEWLVRSDGSVKYRVRMKGHGFRYYREVQLKYIPVGEYNRKSPHFVIPQDFQKCLIVGLQDKNKLGKKLKNYDINNGPSGDSNDHDVYNGDEHELIERLDTSIERYYLGMLSNHSSAINCIKHRINPYLEEKIKKDKNGELRLYLKRRKQTEIDDEKHGAQESSATNNIHLWTFMNEIKRTINSLNKMVNICRKNDGNYNFSIIDTDMDIWCLKLYHILRYFASQSVQHTKKEGAIFDSRDRDSDTIIASWVLYKFQTCLMGKYKAFVDEYQTNYKNTARIVNTWCKKNNVNISNQFEEFTKTHIMSTKIIDNQRKKITAMLYGSTF